LVQTAHERDRLDFLGGLPSGGRLRLPERLQLTGRSDGDVRVHGDEHDARVLVALQQFRKVHKENLRRARLTRSEPVTIPAKQPKEETVKHRKHHTVDVPYTSALIFGSALAPADQAAFGETLLEIADLPELAQAA
jgi:hypothetical protein